MLWDAGQDSVRQTWSLVEPMRCDDKWYNEFLRQCRFGSLSEEMYCLIHGFPTFRPPCPSCCCTEDLVHDDVLGEYRRCVMAAFEAHEDMNAYVAKSQCSECTKIRRARQRVLHHGEPLPLDITSKEFTAAPAIYSFNVPRYFTTQLRAREFGKSHGLQITWVYAKDVPLHREDRELAEEALENKLASWLGRHDQDTCHIASLLPLVVGLPIRLTDRVQARSELQLYRGRRGRIYGWVPDPRSTVEEVDGELLMSLLPKVIYIQFDKATWTIADLPPGVYPLTAVSRTWKVHKATGIVARRTGYLMVPDFASTAHMIQGANLDAVFSSARCKIPVAMRVTHKFLRM